MNISNNLAAMRSVAALSKLSNARLLLVQQRRSLATQNPIGASPQSTRRRKVTAFNDDGHIPWTDLSVREKASRASQQTFNFGMIIVGVVLTGGVGYFLFTEIFSPESKVSYFNRAVDLIKADPTCLSLLGDAKKIAAYGEETTNKWQMSRPISSTIQVDNRGVEHLLMKFHVEGPRNKGVAHVHMTKHPKEDVFEYKYLFVDIRGHDRIYIKNSDEARRADGSKKFKLFGLTLG